VKARLAQAFFPCRPGRAAHCHFQAMEHEFDPRRQSWRARGPVKKCPFDNCRDLAKVTKRRIRTVTSFTPQQRRQRKDRAAAPPGSGTQPRLLQIARRTRTDDPPGELAIFRGPAPPLDQPVEEWRGGARRDGTGPAPGISRVRNLAAQDQQTVPGGTGPRCPRRRSGTISTGLPRHGTAAVMPNSNSAIVPAHMAAASQ
jgi:hypothetical protein